MEARSSQSQLGWWRFLLIVDRGEIACSSEWDHASQLVNPAYIFHYKELFQGYEHLRSLDHWWCTILKSFKNNQIIYYNQMPSNSSWYSQLPGLIRKITHSCHCFALQAKGEWLWAEWNMWSLLRCTVSCSTSLSHKLYPPPPHTSSTASPPRSGN